MIDKQICVHCPRTRYTYIYTHMRLHRACSMETTQAPGSAAIYRSVNKTRFTQQSTVPAAGVSEAASWQELHCVPLFFTRGLGSNTCCAMCNESTQEQTLLDHSRPSPAPSPTLVPASTPALAPSTNPPRPPTIAMALATEVTGKGLTLAKTSRRRETVAGCPGWRAPRRCLPPHRGWISSQRLPPCGENVWRR